MDKVPGYTIQFRRHGFSDNCMEGLNHLIRNKHPEWLRLIRGRKLTQVRLEYSGGHSTFPDRCYIVFVMRERFAAPWIERRTIIGTDPPTGYLETIGLGNIRSPFYVKFHLAY